MKSSLILILLISAGALAIGGWNRVEAKAQGDARAASLAATTRPTSTPWWRLPTPWWRVPASATPRRAPTATPTRTPTPARTGSAPLLIRSLDRVPPADVLKALTFFVGGGGEDYHCSGQPPVRKDFDGYLPFVLTLNYCWPDPDTSLRMTVTGPDLRPVAYNLPLLRNGSERYLDYAYPLGATRKAGVYRVELEGSRRRVSLRLDLTAAKLPAFYWAYPEGVYRSERIREGRRLRLAGFKPNEELSLLVYERGTADVRFSGWKKIRVGADGGLWIAPEFTSDSVRGWTATVVGASGEVHLDDGSGPSFRFTCPGAPPSRLADLQKARALVDIPVYASLEDSTRARVIKAGARVEVTAGPFCRNRAWWWQLDAADLDYTLETYGSKYALEPAR